MKYKTIQLNHTKEIHIDATKSIEREVQSTRNISKVQKIK